MITLHFDHSSMEIPPSLLMDIALKIKEENFSVFVELINAIADNAVKKIYNVDVPAYLVFEVKNYNKIIIDVFVVDHEPLKLKLTPQGVESRMGDWAKLQVEDVKGLLRFFHKYHQHGQIAMLIELPTQNDDDNIPF